MEPDPASVIVRKWSKRDVLWIKAYLERPVLSEAVLSGLEEFLRKTLPTWSSGLQVAVNVDSRTSIAVPPGSLGDVALKVAAPRNGLGSAVLRGSHRGIRVYLDSWEKTSPPELNMIAVEIGKVLTIEGSTPPDWAREFFTAMAAGLPLRYGNARLADEFGAKNMVDDASGLRAIGVKLTEGLPGLYWLNCFGPPYIELIGKEKLLSSPAYVVIEVSGKTVLALDESPLAWRTDDYRAREDAVLRHLGEVYFFLRDREGRKLKAPVFQASGATT
jgi:hypothetical protein